MLERLRCASARRFKANQQVSWLISNSGVTISAAPCRLARSYSLSFLDHRQRFLAPLVTLASCLLFLWWDYIGAVSVWIEHHLSLQSAVLFWEGEELNQSAVERLSPLFDFTCSTKSHLIRGFGEWILEWNKAWIRKTKEPVRAVAGWRKKSVCEY